MINLINNSNFKETAEGGLLYFTKSENITMDNFYYFGNRTCSVTTKEKETASLTYNTLVELENNKTLNFGINIRAINASNLNLKVVFLDSAGEDVKTDIKNISPKVSYKFRKVISSFNIPSGATSAKLSIEFLGETTACSFMNPVAYLK